MRTMNPLMICTLLLCSLQQASAFSLLDNSRRTLQTPQTPQTPRLSQVSQLSSSPSSSSCEHLDVNTDSKVAATAKDEPAQCPFSRAFPRYRIDLTYRKESTTNPNFFTKLNHQRILRQQPKRASSKALEIVEVADCNGVECITYLWNALAQRLQQSDDNDNGNNDDDDGDDDVILYFPNASFRLLENWVEIVNWMVDMSTVKQGETEQQAMDMFDGATAQVALISQQQQQDQQRQQQQEEQSQTSISNRNKNRRRSGSSKDDTDDFVPAVRIQVSRRNVSPNAGEATSLETPPTCTPQSLEQSTKAWVKRILVEQGICPFTKSTTKSGQGLKDVGVPVGRIAYHSSIAPKRNVVQLMADTWTAIQKMIQAGPEGSSGVSSILLAAPGWDDDFDSWSGPVFCVLESSVVAANAQDQIGVVCFHPQYATPDGSTWPGFGHMHSVPRLEEWYNAHYEIEPKPSSAVVADDADAISADARNVESEDQSTDTLAATPASDDAPAPDTSLETVDTAQPAKSQPPATAACPVLSTSDIAAGGAWQRRTPHATINVLRAEQLAAAESRRATQKLYATNIDKFINQIGNSQLEKDLLREQSIAKPAAASGAGKLEP